MQLVSDLRDPRPWRRGPSLRYLDGEFAQSRWTHSRGGSTRLLSIIQLRGYVRRPIGVPPGRRYRRVRRAAALRGGCAPTANGQGEGEHALLATLTIYRTGGLAARPGSCRRIDRPKPGCAEKGSCEVPVLLLKHDSRRGEEFAQRLAGVGVPLVTGLMPAGVWL